MTIDTTGSACRAPRASAVGAPVSVRMPRMPADQLPDPCEGMYRRARVVLPTGAITHTLVGPAGLPVAEVEEFCAYLRASAASPNTIRSYLPGHGPARWVRKVRLVEPEWREATNE